MTNIWTRLGQAKARPGASNDLLRARPLPRCVSRCSATRARWRSDGATGCPSAHSAGKRVYAVYTERQVTHTLANRGRMATRFFSLLRLLAYVLLYMASLYIYIYLARRLMFSPRVRPYHGDQRSALRACSNSSKMPPPLTTSHSSNISSSRLAERCGSKNAVI